MFQLCCIALIPVIATVIAGRNREGARGLVFTVARYLMFALVIVQLTAITMIPLERASMRIAWNGRGGVILYVSYGTVSTAVACVLAVVLGWFSRWQCVKKSICTAIEEKVSAPRVTISGLLVHASVFILMLATTSYAWALGHFGNVGFAEIEFHLRVPLNGTSTEMISNYLKHGFLPSVGWMLVFEALVWFPSRKAYRIVAGNDRRVLLQVFPLRIPVKMAAAGLALWLVFLAVGFDDNFSVVRYISARLAQSSLIEENYVDPRTVEIVFPEEKRNLITIYVESAETTVFDKENGGLFDFNYMPEMTRIAKENISFSHSDKLEGAAVAPDCGWTIAGLVAETSGLPLRLYKRGKANNMMDRFSVFMPGATTIGDILKEEGYRTMFMCGTDLTFGGRRLFYEQHGAYEVRDLLVAKESGRFGDDHYSYWGLKDRSLYDWAKDELSMLAEGDDPFHFSMLTIDTHSPDGYICELCPDTCDEALGNAMLCASKQLDDFLMWCSEQPFYENTTIVVLGDHESMSSEFFQDVDNAETTGSINRKVYNAFIHAVVEPVKEENRLFTTLDFFPTTLAAMGVKIEGDMLGIGVNLFSDKETLAEKYGYEYLFGELEKGSDFYNEVIMFP